jgi:hypothetical protein
MDGVKYNADDDDHNDDRYCLGPSPRGTIVLSSEAILAVGILFGRLRLGQNVWPYEDSSSLHLPGGCEKVTRSSTKHGKCAKYEDTRDMLVFFVTRIDD